MRLACLADLHYGISPRNEAHGHFGSGRPVSLFLSAFSESRRLAEIMRCAASRGARVLAIAGHTHKRVPRTRIDGVDYLNVGGDYGAPHLDIVLFPEEP